MDMDSSSSPPAASDDLDGDIETELKVLDYSFETLDDLNHFLNDYQTQKQVQLTRRHSRTITGERRRGLASNAKDDLVYTELLYVCSRGGGSHAGRGPHRSSYGSKTDCPFFMKIKLSTDGQTLHVTSVSEEHNHPLGEKLENHINRRLHGLSLTKEHPELRDKTIGFIGAGNMAQALAKGFVKSGSVYRKNLYFSAPSNKNLNGIKKKGHETTHDNIKILQSCNVVILAVKPQYAEQVLREIGEHYRLSEREAMLVSIVAGVTIEQLEKHTYGAKVIRAVPNTPAQVCSGVTVFCRGTKADESDARLVRRLFSSVGHCDEVEEQMLNVVTGLAGSGPAFAYLMIQAMSDGAVKMGMSRQQATLFAAHTFVGAGKMVVISGRHPSALQDEVSSPGGTTIHGLHKLEAGGVRSAIIDAVQAATERAQQLSK